MGRHNPEPQFIPSTNPRFQCKAGGSKRRNQEILSKSLRDCQHPMVPGRLPCPPPYCNSDTDVNPGTKNMVTPRCGNKGQGGNQFLDLQSLIHTSDATRASRAMNQSYMYPTDLPTLHIRRQTPTYQFVTPGNLVNVTEGFKIFGGRWDASKARAWFED